MLGLYLSCLKVDIDQRIQFSHENFDIICSHSCAHHGKSLSFVGARMGDKFTLGDLYVHVIKIL